MQLNNHQNLKRSCEHDSKHNWHNEKEYNKLAHWVKLAPNFKRTRKIVNDSFIEASLIPSPIQFVWQYPFFVDSVVFRAAKNLYYVKWFLVSIMNRTVEKKRTLDFSSKFNQNTVGWFQASFRRVLGVLVTWWCMVNL